MWSRLQGQAGAAQSRRGAEGSWAGIRLDKYGSGNGNADQTSRDDVIVIRVSSNGVGSK